VDAITRGLAAESGPRKIRVNAIAPGEVETEGTHSGGIVGSDFEKAMIARTPLGRIGQPDDIARVAIFLASDHSAWLTGERLTAAGGYRSRRPPAALFHFNPAYQYHYQRTRVERAAN
jgi:3-oxoacyl-[acyl-carrier protein] reductase